jgi:5-methylcytosine-specific restriction protein A
MIRHGYEAFGVLCEAKITEGETWRIKSHEEKFLLRLGKFRKRESVLYMRIEENVPVEFMLGNSQDNNSSQNVRLPVSELEKVKADHVWRAIQLLVSDEVSHSYHASTDFDLITDDGDRLPPKAVFGIAASEALGFPVLPIHFYGGEDSPSFRILRQSGFKIIRKGEVIDEEDVNNRVIREYEWAEGGLQAQRHFKRERGNGLSKAKKENFRREHGKLFCEFCLMDPIEIYGVEIGEACIEVHHARIALAEMEEGHVTILSDLKCLCANCHRIEHRKLIEYS